MIVLSQETRRACVSVSLAGDVDEDKEVDTDEKTTEAKWPGLWSTPRAFPLHTSCWFPCLAKQPPPFPHPLSVAFILFLLSFGQSPHQSPCL